MKTKVQRNIDLLRLVLVVTVATGVVTFLNVFYASYQVQRTQLVDATLESNYNYAQKLASSTEDYLQAAQQQLKVSAQLIGSIYNDAALLEKEAERLRTQTDSFNSVVIINNTAKVLAASPETLQIVGDQIQTPGVQQALAQQKPLISKPYLSAVGNLIIFISQPVFNTQGEYLGLVGGSLYLRQPSILNRLLGTHYYRDGSYLYVVTQDKQLIYHPESNRIGDVVNANTVINAVTHGESGRQAIVNSQGVDMLAGYAYIPSAGWGVVAQRPLAAAIAPLDDLMQRVMYKTIPAAVLILLIVWWCARQISAPLRLLAENARSMHVPETEDKIQNVKSWYFESLELKNAMLLGMSLFKSNIDKLNKDVNTDPLTGLHNRRSLDNTLLYLQSKKAFFSVISMDIDHFKRVNDTFGHDVGDRVLQRLAQIMREASREADLPCRVGGEEFLIVLPGVESKGAVHIAERLRAQVEATVMPPVGYITISLGVASWPRDSNDIPAVLKCADEMLYKAKREGRNRVELYEVSTGSLVDASAPERHRVVN